MKFERINYSTKEENSTNDNAILAKYNFIMK